MLRRQKHVLSQSTTPFACTLILGASGREQGGTWYGDSAKPARHFTKGMFGKP